MRAIKVKRLAYFLLEHQAAGFVSPLLWHSVGGRVVVVVDVVDVVDVVVDVDEVRVVVVVGIDVDVVDEVLIGHVHLLPSHVGRPFVQVGGEIEVVPPGQDSVL